MGYIKNKSSLKQSTPVTLYKSGMPVSEWYCEKYQGNYFHSILQSEVLNIYLLYSFCTKGRIVYIGLLKHNTQFAPQHTTPPTENS